MSKQRFVLSIDDTVIQNLEKVADADHLDGTKFAALALAKLSDLKPGRALDALSAIPKDFFRARVGRPPAASTTAESDKEPALEKVS